MTTQPKLPEWAEVFINAHTQTFSLRFPDQQEDFMPMGDVRTLASRLMAERVPEGPKNETAWIVENDDEDRIRYRTMDGYEGIHWTYDANEAIRFSRRADAEMFAAGDESFVRIVEHMWCEPPNPGPAAEPCKTCNDTRVVEAYTPSWEEPKFMLCPNCCGPKQSTYTKLDPPGHAEYVAGKQAEGGGKCVCDPCEACDGKRFVEEPRHGKPVTCIVCRPVCERFVGERFYGCRICFHPAACHEGASHTQPIGGHKP